MAAISPEFWLRHQRPLVLLALVGPLIALGGYWIAGQNGLLAAAPALMLAAVALARRSVERFDPWSRELFVAEVEQRLARMGSQGAGCIVLQIDGAAHLPERYGRAVQAEVIRRLGERFALALTSADHILRLEGGGFAVALSEARPVDIDTVVRIATQLQEAASEPVTFGNMRVLVTCSAGFCLAAQSGADLLDSAQIAADAALVQGPSTLLAYSPSLTRTRAERDTRRCELEMALESGQIRAWFQPQISADTGDVTGFEALARWHHPERGVLPPEDFLPAILELGLSERLSEVIVFNTLSALSRWDAAGVRVPEVGVNFSPEELRNPHLAEKMKWEMDRFDLTPSRLSIEILETVISLREPDVIRRNIAALAQFGCRIDLDDFGTGHASLTNIRRFGVNRLKIDRSYISPITGDRDAQRVITAILSMAEQLGLDTLAEGVETSAEVVLLSQLGCGHVQGYGIARPMPFEETISWIRRHEARPQVTWKARHM